MSTKETAGRLIELCAKGKFLEAQHELYDANIISIETDGNKTQGSSSMNAKERHFLDSIEKINSINFSEPLISGNFFSLILKMEVDFKNGVHQSIEEICVYQVKNGKIIFEQFFS